MAARICTQEQRQQQAAAIRPWKPSERSTEPTTAECKANVPSNAYKGAKWSALRKSIEALSQMLTPEVVAERDS